jgi:hypothetical protein
MSWCSGTGSINVCFFSRFVADWTPLPTLELSSASKSVVLAALSVGFQQFKVFRAILRRKACVKDFFNLPGFGDFFKLLGFGDLCKFT